MPSYIHGCNEEQHYSNIESLIAEANTIGSDVLGVNGYKYGVAQKLLNLIMKYNWCLGHIKEPPHCPIDRIIIDKTKFKHKMNWTELKSRQDYENIINEVKKIASIKNLTLAKWELLNYARR